MNFNFTKIFVSLMDGSLLIQKNDCIGKISTGLWENLSQKSKVIKHG